MLENFDCLQSNLEEKKETFLIRVGLIYYPTKIFLKNIKPDKLDNYLEYCILDCVPSTHVCEVLLVYPTSSLQGLLLIQKLPDETIWQSLSFTCSSFDRSEQEYAKKEVFLINTKTASKNTYASLIKKKRERIFPKINQIRTTTFADNADSIKLLNGDCPIGSYPMNHQVYI